jgi:ubiquitin conjugation factor E4 B
LRRHPRVDIKEETKLNADQSTSDRFYSEAVGGINFISEVFFLTLAAHHYGSEATIVSSTSWKRSQSHGEADLEVRVGTTQVCQ